MNSNTEEIHDFYGQHSIISDPRKFAHLFAPLPRKISALVEIVQGLIIHAGWMGSYGLRLPPERRQELHLRTIPEMLERILVLDSAPLLIPRAPNKRLVGICRDFAVLLVSILRYQGVPSRLRVGFAGYIHQTRLTILGSSRHRVLA